MDVTFEKLCKIFLLKEPFYGIILTSFNKKETRKIPTIGVAPDGNTFKLYYNPDFLNRLSNNTVMELLKHEMEHICFSHMFMGRETGYDMENHELFNIACDLECNSYLDRSIITETDGYWPEDFGFSCGMSAKRYYLLLKEWMNRRQSSQSNRQIRNNNAPTNFEQDEDDSTQNASSDSNIPDSNTDDSESDNQKQDSKQEQKGQNRSGKSTEDNNTADDELKARAFDNHDDWEDMSDDEAERTEEYIKSIIVTAAESVEKSYSKDHIPEAMRIRIDSLRKKTKPIADWRRFCRRFMGNEYSYYTKKSRRRESLRFPDMAGTRHQRTSKILVAIDTSGSVSMPEYVEFMQQIMTMRNVVSFDIVECDTDIRHKYTFKNTVNMELHGGGGTNFQPPVDLYYKDGTYDCLIYFTDGDCEIPDNTPKDTLWVISSRGLKNNDYTKNGAKVIFIPQNESI